MRTSTYKIKRESRVGKTQLLYDGPAENLRKVKVNFSAVKSSDVYPALESGFENGMYFYSTDSAFISKLKQFCEQNLKGPSGGNFLPGGRVVNRYLGPTLRLLFFLLVLYGVYRFLLFFTQIFVRYSRW